MNAIDNVNVALQELLATPATIKQRLPLSQRAEQSVLQGRRTVEAILDRRDPRLIVVVGPCSIHDVDAAMEYAQKLKKLSDTVADTLYLVMRVYFEKPRTSTGWKGLINDPDMDDSFHLEKGLTIARKLLLDVVELGLPAGTEALDPIMPQYISDLISWTAIGARTTESQTHREMSSGLSTPVGFKNGTDGSVDVAINAMKSASSPHHFLGINQQGQCSVFRTKGNPYGHVVLRGGGEKTNYDAHSIAGCEQVLQQAGLAKRIFVDCSHANSNKQFYRQPVVLDECVEQIVAGNQSIVGLMLESHLHEGNQSIPADLSQLKYGVSVTDSCIDWQTTEETLLRAREKLTKILPNR